MSIDTSKIIHAPVGGGRYTVTAPIVKEDYGLYLLIEGLELPSTYEVDFSNSEHNGTSVTMIGNSDGVLIPHQFIDTGKDIFAFLYHVGSDYGRTVFKFRIPNKLRPDRTNEEPTPEEQSVIDQAIAALNDAVEQTAQAVEDAEESAQTSAESARASGESALSASNSALSAGEYASNALSHAESASASATASAQSAEASARCSADAQDSAEEAQASASASAQSASASENSASQASTSATSASQSASSAQGYASQAQTSANTASTKASEASTSAQTAGTKASEASGYATTASNKATEASGYATSASQAKTDAESARDSAQGYASDAQGYANDAQASAESISASVSQIAQNTADILKAFPTDTASGAVASFSDGADNIPLKSLIVNIDPVQSGTGDPSPDNVRPISGWNSVKVTRSGESALKPSTAFTETKNGLTFTSDGKGTYSVKGTNTATTTVRSSILPVPSFTIPPSSTHTLCINNNAINSDVLLSFMNGSTAIDSWSFNALNREASTYLAMGNKLCDVLQIAVRAGQTVDITFSPMLLPKENTVVYSISFSSEGTIYGGTLDVLTGVLTAYPYYASYNGETLTGRWISDRDVYAVGTTPTIGAQVVDMSGTGTEVQLEPHEVASLLGANNLWADTGDTVVEYRADTKLYIEKLTQPEEDDMIVDSAITSGQFFMIGNSLYRALANIASGATITVGTNAERVSLSDALNLVNA